MDASFMVTNQRSGCCEVVGIAGELDMSTAPHLEAVVDRMMVIPDHIVVDVSELAFIDSAGLSLLLRASNLVDRRIWLKGASYQFRRLLDLSGLTERFCLEQDVLSAHRIISAAPRDQGERVAVGARSTELSRDAAGARGTQS